MNGTISVTDFQRPGISILAYNPEFAALLPPTASQNVRDISPYSVIVRNGAPEPVLAYTVSWATTDAMGQTYKDYRTVCGANDAESQIPPNTDKLITVLNSPNEDAASYLQRFQREPLTITLESVMFEDGSTAGGDTSESMAQVKALLKAEFDLLQSVLAKDRSSIMSWLQGRVDSGPRPGSRLDLSNPFAGWYRFYQAKQAARLIRIAEVKGVSEMIASVQITLQNKRYPAALGTWRGQ